MITRRTFLKALLATSSLAAVGVHPTLPEIQRLTGKVYWEVVSEDQYILPHVFAQEFRNAIWHVGDTISIALDLSDGKPSKTVYWVNESQSN